MKRTILKGEHWQFFLIILFGFILQTLNIEQKPVINIFFKLIGAIFYFSWIILAGNTLFQLLPNKIEFNYNFWIINTFIWTMTYFAVTVISDGQGMTFNGIEIIPLLYVFYAVLNCMAFPARLLKSIEKGKKAELGEYIGDFFLVLFLPVGIWFLQPRINKIAKELELKLSEQ
jgi:hypothetical protein